MYPWLDTCSVAQARLPGTYSHPAVAQADLEPTAVYFLSALGHRDYKSALLCPA